MLKVTLAREAIGEPAKADGSGHVGGDGLRRQSKKEIPSVVAVRSTAIKCRRGRGVDRGRRAVCET